MSINWVERRSDLRQAFTLLPLEQLTHLQEERVTMKLTPIGQPKPETITLKGHVYLTNQRLVLLSDQVSAHDNFSLLFKDISANKLVLPWFGSNHYEIVFKVTNAQGGLNYLYDWKAVIEFPYGGAVKFNKMIEGLVKDELPQYTP